MRIQRWGWLALLALAIGVALPVYAGGPDLVVTGSTLLTPATVPACGFNSICVTPGGVLTIATTTSTTPLKINVQKGVLIAGQVRVVAADVSGCTPKPTANGGAVFFNLPKGAFIVAPTGLVAANVVGPNGVCGNGGFVEVIADTITIAGTLDVNGSLTKTAARAGAIELHTNGALTVANPAIGRLATLATLTATGYYGGVIRLLTLTGDVDLSETSLVDVRGNVGTAFDGTCPYSNTSLVDIESGAGVDLSGFRLYTVDRPTCGIGRFYAASRGPIEVTPISVALLLNAAFAEQATYGDTNLGLPSGHAALLLYTATHLGDVCCTANLGVGVEISAANSVDISGCQLGAYLSVKAGGFLFLTNGSAVGPVTLQASRIQIENETLPVRFTRNETGKPTTFANDSFAPGEVFTTPCGLKLVGCKIGAGVSITCEGTLALVGTDIGDNATLNAGVQWTYDFDRALPVDTQILELTGGKCGSGVSITTVLPPDCPAGTALANAITGTNFGTNLSLNLLGCLNATGLKAGDNADIWADGNLKLTGGTFTTATIHYTGTKRVSGVKGNVTFIDHF